ncbi:TPA: toll/interleukin-1 receptor domain-containing protein [Streptococcus suis]|nr:toll/interleukin-1 receptor domain-containing protein [Streptococcus suis]
MGIVMRQYNDFYIKFQRQFKKAHEQVIETLPVEFSKKDYVERFKYMFPDKILQIEKQRDYWYGKYIIRINLSKIQSRGMSLENYDFILATSKHIRNRKREKIASNEERLKKIDTVRKLSLERLKVESRHKKKVLNYIQEVDPPYLKNYRDKFFKTHDLHERLEIIRELSKYNSQEVQRFFYAINGHIRNQSLKIEVQSYFQNLYLPFRLSRKKKGKKNFIDNEIVKNQKGPDELKKRLYIIDLEKIKKFDVFLSHNSRDEEKIIEFYKKFNKKGQVVYIDWINDKYDLRREWCNASTVDIIKERIKQSDVFVLYFSGETLNSQWCTWELGYADALGKKICVYFSEEINRKGIPKFYVAYPELQMSKNIYVKIKGNEETLLEEWKKL